MLSCYYCNNLEIGSGIDYLYYLLYGRSSLDENNDSVSKSWIVFRHRIVAKLTSAVEFSTAEDLAKCYSVSRSAIDESATNENNESVRGSWIIFHHGIVAKLTSAAEFSGTEDLSLQNTEQCQCL